MSVMMSMRESLIDSLNSFDESQDDNEDQTEV